MIQVKINRKVLTRLFVVIILIQMAGCNQNGSNGKTAGDKLTGKIEIDGSSTVFPITAAVAEEFMKEQGNVEIGVSQSGTGGGMKKFYAGEIGICDASRPIKPEEADQCSNNGIKYTEFIVGYDGITVVVNRDNDWVETITTGELKKIWQKNSNVKTWKDVNPKWPDKPLKLYGPGTDSGTFEFFTEEINGEAKSSRKEFSPSEDDNVLVTGVASDKYAMGYFGYAYYLENKDQLKALKIDTGNGGVEPSFDSIKDGSYKPLSRPLYIYVNNDRLKEEHVLEFMRFYFNQVETLVNEVGYVPLTDYGDEKAKLEK